MTTFSGDVLNSDNDEAGMLIDQGHGHQDRPGMQLRTAQQVVPTACLVGAAGGDRAGDSSTRGPSTGLEDIVILTVSSSPVLDESAHYQEMGSLDLPIAYSNTVCLCICLCLCLCLCSVSVKSPVTVCFLMCWWLCLCVCAVS